MAIDATTPIANIAACKICKSKKFACVYATIYGCIIQGWTDKEGELNGKKQHCHIYKVDCIRGGKCEYCGHLCENREE